MKDIIPWKEEAWDAFLTKFWDNRKEGEDIITYTANDLEPFLKKYSKSGQGEIRIFHYEHEKIKAVKRRDIVKIPITRKSWAITKSPQKINFTEPSILKQIGSERQLTDGMVAGIRDTLNKSSNPGETTLLAIANHMGIISDFYEMKDDGILFTGGRQNAGIHFVVGIHDIDMRKGQIEIDGGFEWPDTIVVVEIKSSFKQADFDTNQALLPMLKWKKAVTNKKVYSLVLLAETKKDVLEYRAYDLEQDTIYSPLGMKIIRSKKYIINLKI